MKLSIIEAGLNRRDFLKRSAAAAKFASGDWGALGKAVMSLPTGPLAAFLDSGLVGTDHNIMSMVGSMLAHGIVIPAGAIGNEFDPSDFGAGDKFVGVFNLGYMVKEYGSGIKKFIAPLEKYPKWAETNRKNRAKGIDSQLAVLEIPEDIIRGYFVDRLRKSPDFMINSLVMSPLGSHPVFDVIKKAVNDTVKNGGGAEILNRINDLFRTTPYGKQSSTVYSFAVSMGRAFGKCDALDKYMEDLGIPDRPMHGSGDSADVVEGARQYTVFARNLNKHGILSDEEFNNIKKSFLNLRNDHRYYEKERKEKERQKKEKVEEPEDFSDFSGDYELYDSPMHQPMESLHRLSSIAG